MDINSLRVKPHLSASAINDYCECGLLYKFSRIDKLKPESKSADLVFGSTVHSVLAEFYCGLMIGQQLSVEHLEEIFEAQWRFLAQDNQEIQYKPEKSFDSMLLEGKSLINTFLKELHPDQSKIIGVEETFSFMIDGLSIPIIGVFDPILAMEDEAGVVVVDHKTASKSMSDKDVDQNFQMTVYHLAAKANGFAGQQILLRLDCLIKTKTPKFAQYYTSRTEMDEIKAAKKIIAVWDGISKRVFIPNPESWKCASCSYKSVCEAWFMKK